MIKCKECKFWASSYFAGELPATWIDVGMEYGPCQKLGTVLQVSDYADDPGGGIINTPAEFGCTLGEVK